MRKRPLNTTKEFFFLLSLKSEVSKPIKTSVEILLHPHNWLHFNPGEFRKKSMKGSRDCRTEAEYCYRKKVANALNYKKHFDCICTSLLLTHHHPMKPPNERKVLKIQTHLLKNKSNQFNLNSRTHNKMITNILMQAD